MGIVVAARHEQLDQRVAIKFVREEALGNEEAVQRFLREARAAVRLRSEHVARVIDVGTLESGAPYMVMEFLEGSDLGHVLAERGPLAVELVAEWIVQACEAVAEAHAAGIVHRDIKPQNLFLTRTVGGGSKIKVLDFGVSKADAPATGALTQTKAMLGSPLYMSPEQMRSARSVDARADVWALGVVMFELLTQRWPFEAETMPELCLKVVSDQPHSLAALRPELPMALVDVVERCLEKDPAKRYANAAELASALEAFAPPASRVIAERARMAVSSLTKTTAAAPHPDVAAGGSGAAAKDAAVHAVARTAPTPAAWDSARDETPPGVKRKGPLVLWLALGGAAIGGVATWAIVSRAHHEDVAPSTGASVSTPPRIASAPPATTTAGDTTASAPGPTADPPNPNAATADSGPPSTNQATGIPPAATTKKTVAPPIPPPHTTATGKATSRDDDIPSMR